MLHMDRGDGASAFSKAKYRKQGCTLHMYGYTQMYLRTFLHTVQNY